MTNNPMQHLSEEELDDVLIGVGSAEAENHIATCELCSAEIATFRSSVHAFNDGSLAWAQAKSNTVSRDLSTARLSTTSTHPLAWSTGVAMIAAVAFSLSGGMHRAPATLDTAHPPMTEVATVDNAQEIAADNAMLAAINSEISTSAPAPLQPFRRVATISRRTPGSEGNN